MGGKQSEVASGEVQVFKAQRSKKNQKQIATNGKPSPPQVSILQLDINRVDPRALKDQEKNKNLILLKDQARKNPHEPPQVSSE